MRIKATGKFKIIDKIDRIEIIYNALKNFDSGVNAYVLARKVGCNPETIYKYLNILTNRSVVKRWKVGTKNKFYAVKKIENFNIRKYLEEEFIQKKYAKPMKYAVSNKIRAEIMIIDPVSKKIEEEVDKKIIEELDKNEI